MKIIKAAASANGEYLSDARIPELIPDTKTEMQLLNIYPVKAQTWLGFGGAFTEASAYCYDTLGNAGKAEIIRNYFSPDGIGCNFCRMHIGSCDFSLSEYAYTEPDDRTLSTFDLGNDRKYLLPFLRDALKASPDMFLFASPWSPPYWMKESRDARHGGKLSDEWKPVWAEYVAKYIEAYAAEGVKIQAVTVQNEPIASQTWESCNYSAADEAELIRDYLAPVFDRHGLDTKIIIWDHNKERLYERAAETLSDKSVRDRVWGIGFHWYSGGHFDGVALTHEAFPDKPLIETEFCRGLPFKDADAMSYAYEILRNMNSGASASVDWNMILDQVGGPYHYRFSGCTSPIAVNRNTHEIMYTPVYYATAHFAGFIPTGSVRLRTSTYDDSIPVTAFERPDGKIAAVILNTSSVKRTAALRLENHIAKFSLDPGQITSVLIEK